MKGLGRQVEEKTGEESGKERGGLRPTPRGVRDRELKEETLRAGAAASHDQTFVTDTTASMMQPEPPMSLRARMSSIDCPGISAASWAPFP